MLADLASFLGGRVAEEIAIGDVTTGASNDIERATKLAKQMVTQFGMSEKLGPQTFGEANHEVFLGRDFSANADYSPEVAYEIDKEISRLIDDAYEKARTILTERRSQLDQMAAVLIERETIGKDELLALLEDRWDEYVANEPPGDDDNDASAAVMVEEAPAEAEEPEVMPDPPMAPGTPPAFNA